MVRSTLTGPMADRIVIGHMDALKIQYAYMAKEIMDYISSEASVSYAVPASIEVLEPHVWTNLDGYMRRHMRENWEVAKKQGGWMLDLWTSAMETDNFCIAVGSFFIRLRYDTEVLMQMNRDPNNHDIKRIHQLVVQKYHEMNGTFFKEDDTNLTLPMI